MSDHKPFKEYWQKNQGFYYGVTLTILILLLAKFVFFEPCCPGEGNGTLPPKKDDEECVPHNTKVLISLSELTVECEGGVDRFEKYSDKFDRISHPDEYNGPQGAMPLEQWDVAPHNDNDPAYLGFVLCDGTISGVKCNEPPDQFAAELESPALELSCNLERRRWSDTEPVDDIDIWM